MWEFYIVSVGVCFTLLGLGMLMGYATGDMSPDLALTGFLCVLAFIPLANLYLVWNFTEGVVGMFGAMRDSDE